MMAAPDLDGTSGLQGDKGDMQKILDGRRRRRIEAVVAAVRRDANLPSRHIDTWSSHITIYSTCCSLLRDFCGGLAALTHLLFFRNPAVPAPTVCIAPGLGLRPLLARSAISDVH